MGPSMMTMTRPSHDTIAVGPSRKRRRPCPTATSASLAVRRWSSICILLSTTSSVARAAVWTNTPEDRFFCGLNWDDDDCQKRQHCPSGRSEDCEGHESGVKCFANTNCDTRFGHGDWFVPGQAPKQSPGGTQRPSYGGTSEEASDHYWCGVGLADANRCGTHCPGGVSSECPQGSICYHNIYECDARNFLPPSPYPTTIPPTKAPTPRGPTKVPTDMPIGAPPPLGTSDDPSDHWFCGIGLDDANARCQVPCPTAKECPMGQICYFGTQCDRRTHAPTPPPSRPPTVSPTLSPTESPTFTMLPTPDPTASAPPSAAPSEMGPTKSPTPSPSKRPTYAPMPSLQASFFCGSTWQDAITNCKRRCPSGESTECPYDDHCFSLTPCTEELGYPEEIDGIGDENESGGSGGKPNEGGEACVPFKVRIVADHWPKETSWEVEDLDFGDKEHSIILNGNDKELVPGEPVEWLECINNRHGCYEFTISDAGGDGMCCGHGSGSYKVWYDAVELKEGGSFYDSEKTSFGLCGETEQPTKQPTQAPIKRVANSGGSKYRCVASQLVESGYEVSEDKCALFVDCYNPHINVGDDWFCDKDDQCVETPACDRDDGTSEAMPSPVASNRPTPRPTAKAVASRPVPRPKPAPETSPDTAIGSQTPAPVPIDSTTTAPTMLPTTFRPTLGPCDGEKCLQEDHCRSIYGFCGPGEIYCEEGHSIWSKDCLASEAESAGNTSTSLGADTGPPVSLSPSTSAPDTQTPVSGNPTELPTALSPPTYKKPSNGKGTASKPTRPARTHSPIAYNPMTRKPTSKPTDNIVITDGPTTASPSRRPTSQPADSVAATNRPTTASLSLEKIQPTRPPSNRPTAADAANPPPPPPPPEETNDAKPALDDDERTPPPAKDSDVNTTDVVATDVVATNSTASTALVSSSTPAVDDPGCSGEPCPVDTHCRSRYGSCGPGFIYCNKNSIWKSHCPAVPPGTRPTMRPTPKPSRAPSMGFVASSPGVPASAKEPTFPPLAKPSLPHITEATPFTIPSSFSLPDNDLAESDVAKDEKEEVGVAEDTGEPAQNSFFSPEYLDQWVMDRDGNFAPQQSISLTSAILSAFALILLLS